MIDIYGIVPLDNLLESERKAWADKIGVMAEAPALPDIVGQAWVKYEDHKAIVDQLVFEIERLKGGLS